MDSLDKKSRLFFQQCKRGELQDESMDNEFHSLRGEYFRVMEDADEKVAIATQIHELVERYLRRLDSELFKFKCELEADNNGITEILEKRSLELDGNNSTAATALLYSINQKENRYYNTSTVSNNNPISGSINSSAGIIASTGIVSGNIIVNSSALSNLSGINSQVAGHPRHRKLEKRRETICTVPVQEKRANINQSLPVASISVSGSGNTLVNPIAANLVSSITTHVSLPVAVSSTNNAVTVPVSGNVVRQMSGNLTAHSVHNSNNTNIGTSAAPVATINNNISVGVGLSAVASASPSTGVSGNHGNAMVSYNLQQLTGGVGASSAIAAAASQAIVATQQMPQGRRTASLKASFEAINGAGVSGTTEFWSAATGHNSNTPAAGSLGSHHHHHHPPQQHHHHQQEKKHKK